MKKNKTATHYIDGQWVEGQGTAFHSLNPATGTDIWHGTMATDSEIVAACAAARKALPQWSQLDFSKRAQYLLDFGRCVEKRRQELTVLIAEETGKPLWEAATEVNAVIGKVALSLQSYQERSLEKSLPTAEDGTTNHLRYKPHGVIAILGPFNFPAHLSNGHIIPALLAGNTVVYKPSELTPAVADFILECWHECHIPPGVINSIQGDASVAKALIQQDIQGVYFTGSYKTGLNINKQLSDRPEIILVLEMGGNNPLIIDRVDNLHAAVYNTLLSAFISAGQRCTCARRVLIADNAEGDRFLEAFIKASKTLRVGRYTDKPEPFIGPVIRYEHALIHLEVQKALIHSGGKALLPMSLLAEKTGLLTPGIIDMSDVPHPTDEEIFAPLTQIHRYRDFEHALTLANQTQYGLVAGLLSDNPQTYQQFFQTIRAGLINWNKPTTGAASNLPFGGVGHSGNHRPSAFFAADYCAYPIASIEQAKLTMPTQRLAGIEPE